MTINKFTESAVPINKIAEDLGFLTRRFGFDFIKSMNAKRFRNIVNSYIARRFGFHIFKPLRPVTLFIEVVRGCNFSCVMCPASQFEIQFMSFDTFKEILEKFHDATFIFPYGVGEPFLNKETYKMLKYAVQKGFQITPFTNLSKIDPDELIKTGVKYVFASIDSTNPQEFSQIRKNGNLDKFIENLKLIIERKKALNSHTPKIGFSITLFDNNTEDIESVVELGLSYGVDTFFFQTVFKVDILDTPGDIPTKQQIEKVKSLKSKYKGRARILLTSHYDYEKGDFFTGYCLFAYTTIFIDVEGKIFPCVYAAPISKRNQNFGYISDVDGAISKRQTFLENFRKAKPEYCKGCPVYCRNF